MQLQLPESCRYLYSKWNKNKQISSDSYEKCLFSVMLCLVANFTRLTLIMSSNLNLTGYTRFL